jgi:hypothetical protein
MAVMVPRGGAARHGPLSQIAPPPLDTVSGRLEREGGLLAAAEGGSTGDIGASLFLSPATVRN